MNKASLPIYESVSDVTLYLQDIFYVAVIPSIVVVGFFIKLITLNVLNTILSSKKPNFIFYYMFAFESVDFMAGIILAFLALFECGRFCDIGYKFITKLFELIFFTYLTNVALLFSF